MPKFEESKKPDIPESESKKTEKKSDSKKESAALAAMIEDKGFWSRISEKTKEKLTDIYEGVGLADTVDRAKVVVNRTIMKLHTHDAVIFKKDFKEREDRVALFKAKYDDHDASLKRMKELGVEENEDIKAEFDKEKAKLQEKINNETKKAEQVRGKLEKKNIKRERYETKIKSICEKAKDRIDERLKPYEEEITELKSTKETLTSEITAFRETRKDFNARVKELEKAAKSAKWSAERKAFNNEIKKVKTAMKLGEKIEKDKTKELLKIGKSIFKNEKKAAPWRAKRNEFARFHNMESPDIPIPPMNMEEFKKEKSAERSASSFEGYEKSERSNPKFDTYKMIDLWNKYFSSELKLDKDILKKLSPRGELASEMTVREFTRLADLYNRDEDKKEIPSHFKDNTELFKSFVVRYLKEKEE